MFKKTKEEFKFIFDKINQASQNTKNRFDKIENDIKSQHKNIFTTLRKEIDEKIDSNKKIVYWW